KFFHWFAQIKPYAILTLIPLFFTLLFGGAFSPVSNTNVPVLIYDMDGSNESRQLVDYFAEYPYLNIYESVSSMAQLEEAMLSGEALGAVIVPDGFGADLQSRSGAEVLVMQDSSNFMNMSTIMQAVSNISGTMNAGIRLKLLQAGGMLPEQAAKNVLSLSVVDRGLYNPTYGYLYFLFPGLLAVFVQQ
ncbi:MAG: ABC transporter permease, partial [Firmicutes bacterium]|nr:ABC transporter permease [Bacillota bacterium]